MDGLINSGKIEVALNLLHRIFLNFAKVAS